MPNVATVETVALKELLDFLRPRHKGIYVATRGDGRPQLSPVSCGVDPEGRIVVSTYPRRAKTSNTRRDPEVSICVLSDHFDGPGCTCTGRPRCSTCLKPLSLSSTTSVPSPANIQTGTSTSRLWQTRASRSSGSRPRAGDRWLPVASRPRSPSAGAEDRCYSAPVGDPLAAQRGTVSLRQTRGVD